MRNLIIASFIFVLAVSSSCVRMPEGYTYILERTVETNEEILRKTETYTVEQREEIYRRIIEEDNEVLKATIETIRKGGGK